VGLQELVLALLVLALQGSKPVGGVGSTTAWQAWRD